MSESSDMQVLVKELVYRASSFARAFSKPLFIERGFIYLDISKFFLITLLDSETLLALFR